MSAGLEHYYFICRNVGIGYGRFRLNRKPGIAELMTFNGWLYTVCDVQRWESLHEISEGARDNLTEDELKAIKLGPINRIKLRRRDFYTVETDPDGRVSKFNSFASKATERKG